MRSFWSLPTPLQFEKENFEKSIKDPKTIINTLRLNDKNGEIVGFVKGGALEKYKLREEIRDENYGLEKYNISRTTSIKDWILGAKRRK